MLGLSKPKKLLGDMAAWVVRRALRDSEVRLQLWQIVHRPTFTKFGPKSLWLTQFELAAAESAAYVMDNMLTAKKLERYDLLAHCLASREVDGLHLEFGCGYTGSTARFIAERIDGELHGFDSFEGLPEDWFGDLGVGSLVTNRTNLQFPKNVKLHKGWFSETLPGFVREYQGPIAFMHIDCDLYSSTKDVFDGLKDRIIKGTVIQFDEYFNYPGWRRHEFKAFQEFVESNRRSYEYLGYASRGYCAAVKMTN